MATKSLKDMSTGGRIGLGLLVISLGLLPMLVAVDVIHADPSTIHAPRWVLFLAGVVFVFAGLMVLAGGQSRWSDAMAALLCLCFAAVAAWAALLAPGDKMSGGLWFLPHGVNVTIGRAIFGIGALTCLAIAVYALRRAARGAARRPD